mmetsp:Transcript_6777/g.27694  ORF Transcript_6777/g.27694 Transcript_6777/m.27694 type:complete len:207 (+) Transcript_6777:725-1345(+)
MLGVTIGAAIPLVFTPTIIVRAGAATFSAATNDLVAVVCALPGILPGARVLLGCLADGELIALALARHHLCSSLARLRVGAQMAGLEHRLVWAEVAHGRPHPLRFGLGARHLLIVRARAFRTATNGARTRTRIHCGCALEEHGLQSRVLERLGTPGRLCARTGARLEVQLERPGRGLHERCDGVALRGGGAHLLVSGVKNRLWHAA